MGGSDDPSNLVVLTVEQHAKAHRILWETYGLKQDNLAWKALSGQLTNQEIWLEKSRLGGKALKGYKHSDESKLNYKNAWTTERKISVGSKVSSSLKNVPKSEEHKNSMMGKRPHVMQKGEKNNNAKAVKTPYGIFGSAKDASRYFEKNDINIKYNTMMYKINTNKAGWSYYCEGN